MNAFRVESGLERRALEIVRNRPDVQFAELDVLHQRQFSPNDPQFSAQWHHQSLASTNAWRINSGEAFVRIAIVDTPFQMNHPDLQSNTAPGWDVVNEQPITESSGILHSTATAGMAAAVIHNQLGIAGVSNCQILPININGFTSEMYNAVIWAADNGVRVVNISWDGANSPSLNEAGLYLENKLNGMLIMPGLNGSGSLDYPNHPHIVCVSMTDAAENMQSRDGDHIDFSAPGWDVLTTAHNGGYATVRGTSYSAPLVAGIVGVLFSINPRLTPDAVFQILKETALDFGRPGWDPFFGWGRIHFGKAAEAAAATLPRLVINNSFYTSEGFTASFQRVEGMRFTLWKTPRLDSDSWIPVTHVIQKIEGTTISLTDPDPLDRQAFYKVQGKFLP
ncbi:MAG: S8 family serine peptidase [Verrucomicrobiota bacterium]